MRIVPSNSPFAGSLPAASFILAMTLRSIPPAKSFLPLVMTMPFTAASPSATPISTSSSASPSSDITFIDLPGTSQVITATPSASTS